MALTLDERPRDFLGRDMNPADWDELERLFGKFVQEEKAEPEHAADAKVTAAGVMLTAPDGQILFLQRGEDSDHPGQWSFPGGGIDGDETPEEAAIREVREETGWIKPDDLESRLRKKATADNGYVTYKQKIGSQFIPTLDEENSGYAWATLDNAPQPLHPGIKEVMAQLAADDLSESAWNSLLEEYDRPRDAQDNIPALSTTPNSGIPFAAVASHANKRKTPTAPSLDSDMGKVSKLNARYQDTPNGSKQCLKCSMFRKPDQCSLVSGIISSRGYCRHFDARYASDQKEELIKPKSYVKETPIKPVKGVRKSDVPRADMARTGVPEIDAVLEHSIINKIINNPVVDRSRIVPYEAGGSVPINDPTTYVDKNVPETFTVARFSDPDEEVTFDTAEPTVIHENVEEYVMDVLIDAGMSAQVAYLVAHFCFAEVAEHAWYRYNDIDPLAAEKQWHKIEPGIQKQIDDDSPPNLYVKEYPDADVTEARHEQVFGDRQPTEAEKRRGFEIMRKHFKLDDEDSSISGDTLPYHVSIEHHKGLADYHGKKADEGGPDELHHRAAQGFHNQAALLHESAIGRPASGIPAVEASEIANKKTSELAKRSDQATKLQDKAKEKEQELAFKKKETEQDQLLAEQDFKREQALQTQELKNDQVLNQQKLAAQKEMQKQKLAMQQQQSQQKAQLQQQQMQQKAKLQAQQAAMQPQQPTPGQQPPNGPMQGQQSQPQQQDPWQQHYEPQSDHSLPAPPAADSALAYDHLAFDRGTVRTYDKDGRLHVAQSHISKANICPYRGAEIPDNERLGLDPSRIYYLLRHPDELAKAAPTFNGLPILADHVPVTADDHHEQQRIVIGATGTDAKFNFPFLDNSLVIWPRKDGIDDIESQEKKELSSAYHYDALMTPGTYEGQHYDGVMTNIVGNHVALVKEGRAGSDVVVGDSMKEFKRMANQNRLTPTAAAAMGALTVYLRPKLAADVKFDWGDLLGGVTSKNFKQRKAGIIAKLNKQLAGKIAQDANVAGLAALLDALEGEAGPQAGNALADPQPAQPMPIKSQGAPEGTGTMKDEDPMMGQGAPQMTGMMNDQGSGDPEQLKQFLIAQGLSPEAVEQACALMAGGAGGAGGPPPPAGGAMGGQPTAPAPQGGMGSPPPGHEDGGQDEESLGKTDAYQMATGKDEGSLAQSGQHDVNKQLAGDNPPSFRGMPRPGGGMAGDGRVDMKAMDAAIKEAAKAAIKQAQDESDKRLREAVAAERKLQRDIRDAEQFVLPWVGRMNIAADSAEDVYKAALISLGVKLDNIPSGAYRSILEFHPKPGRAERSSVDRYVNYQAMDSSGLDDFFKFVPGAEKIDIL